MAFESFPDSHSGARFLVDGSRLTKIVPYTKRAIESIELQNSFPRLTINGLSLQPIPISDVQRVDDELFITMPYINGICGSNLISSGDSSLSCDIRSLLSLYLSHQLSFSAPSYIHKTVFLDKVTSLAFCFEKEIYESYRYKVLRSIELEGDSQHFLSLDGPSHGDLTLSNLLYDGKGTFYLFDFLTSYFMSPLSDFCKLQQECLYGWSARFSTRGARSSAVQFLQSIYPVTIANLITSSYPNTYRVASLVNLLRIAPYLSDRLTHLWLCSRLDHALGLMI